jgi:Uma2 family endonuclease
MPRPVTPASVPSAPRTVQPRTRRATRRPARGESRTSAIVIEDKVRIPAGLDSLEAFRRWARSDDFPERGRYAYLNGEMWVDLSQEALFTHNLIRSEFTVTLGSLTEPDGLGYFFSRGTLLSNMEANLSTEPDATFVAYETRRDGRVRLTEGSTEGYVELEGTPDMVLEVVSASSVRKDTEILRELYWRAGIPEYWLVDVRGEKPVFDLLHHVSRAYAATRRHAGGWLRSGVFGRSFRLTQRTDPLGHPQYQVEVR